MYAFDYQRPADRAAATAARTGDGEIRYLAGGQSLVPAMRLRLAAPGRLVDLGGIADLKGIAFDADQLTIGAMTTHASVAASAEVKGAIPALAELASWIGDPMVRNQGTIGGSVANADPAACYPAALLGLGATVVTERREIAADDFFRGLYDTALEDGELVVAVRFPRPERAAYVKFRQQASRFPLVGVFVAQGSAGTRVAVTGARAAVFRLPAFEEALAADFSPDAIRGLKVPADEINGDLHGSAEYRAAMIGVMAQRAVRAALASRE